MTMSQGITDAGMASLATCPSRFLIHQVGAILTGVVGSKVMTNQNLHVMQALNRSWRGTASKHVPRS